MDTRSMAPEVVTTPVTPHVEQMAPIISEATASELVATRSHGRGRRVALAVAGTAAGMVLLSGCESDGISQTAHDIKQTVAEGFVPAPSVSAAGTEGLIKANDFLLETGPYALLAGGLFAGAIAVGRRRSDKLGAMNTATKGKGRMTRIAFSAVTMGLMASAAGLGDTAGDGANKPIEAMAELLGADANTTPIVTGYDNAPLNYSGVKLDTVTKAATANGGKAVPFTQNLGEVKRPDASANPSSAPILAIPNDVLQRSLGVSMPELPKDSCADLSVVVGEQLGAKVGDTVLVNDHKAKVAKTVDIKPGLDRVVAVGSLEQMQQCVFPEQPLTGAVILGADGKMAQLQADLQKEQGASTYSVRSFKAFEEKYKEFWDHSVKPPEMNLILDLSIVAALALAAQQTNEIIRRKKMMAMYLSQGVDRKTLSRAHTLSAQYDNVLAAVGSVVPATVLTAVTNSSQYGLEAAVTPNIIGAGYTTVAAITGLSSLLAARNIKKLDTPAELRGEI